MNASNRPFRRSAPIAAWPAAALLAAALVGCAREKGSDPAVVRAEIEAANKQFMETFSRADAAGLAGAYTEDAQVFPPGSQAVEGRAAIEALWKGLFSLPVKEFQLETREIYGHGDEACEVGRYRLIANDASVFETGKYVVVWRRGEGGWKVLRHIWNADAPAPALPATAAPDSAK